MYILIIALFVLVLYKFFNLKLHIDFKTFFRRGFKKFDNKFRFILLLSVNRARGKHTVA